MKILVTVASKHGGSDQIGEAIAAKLTESGHVVDRQPPQLVVDIEPYDAVILGSGVYAGHWIVAARKFAQRHAQALRERPVWLFSSGPLGEQLKPAGDPVDVAPLVELLEPRGHRVFAGTLQRHHLGFAERAIVGMVHAPYGDFRPWDEIEGWAREIATALYAERQHVLAAA
jgi:menaquinone-dependent protoporphyrinogen oxidase